MEKIVNGHVVVLTPEQEAKQIADWQRGAQEQAAEEAQALLRWDYRELAVSKIKQLALLTDEECTCLFYDPWVTSRPDS